MNLKGWAGYALHNIYIMLTSPAGFSCDNYMSIGRPVLYMRGSKRNGKKKIRQELSVLDYHIVLCFSFDYVTFYNLYYGASPQFSFTYLCIILIIHFVCSLFNFFIRQPNPTRYRKLTSTSN